jgi:serine/threonine-protein kinase RsbW
MIQIPAHIRVPARIDSLPALLAFVGSCLESQGIGQERLREIELAMEEILVNIFNYAYPDRQGEVEIVCGFDKDGGLQVEVSDQGTPFNSLCREDPDLQAGIEERNIGGLGVFFVKQLIPAILYRWEDGRNILTLPINPTAVL